MTRLPALPLLLSFAAVAVGQQISTAVSCLSAVPSLTVLTSSSPAFPNEKQAFNQRFSPNPDIIVIPTSVSQVQSIMGCATNSSLSVSARSGGHSYAAYGLAGQIVVDLSKFKKITVDNAAGTAAVQAGNRLGDIATELFKNGGRALPHGSCPYVGSGGHTLYGGFGYLSRLGGLLLDRVVSAEVVLANGTLVTASNTSNADLFWALRGGGPGFGLVTTWTYQTLAAPPTTVSYRINFNSGLSRTQVIAAYTTWQTFATSVPKELAMAAVLGASGGNTVSLSFQGTYYGTNAAFQKVIAPLVKALPNRPSLSAKSLGWIDALIADAGAPTLNTSQPDSHDTFFAKSLVKNSPSSNTSITSWINYLATKGSTSDTNWFAQVDLYGGAISEVPADATAFAQRSAFLVYQLYASSSNSNPPYPADGVSFVNGMLAALEPNPQGAYANYMDPTLSTEEWQKLYFGGHVARLQQVKQSVDPKDVFKLSEGF